MKMYGVVYLGFVGKLHQMVHKRRGLGALRVSHLLHLQVTLCAKNNVDISADEVMAACSAAQRTHPSAGRVQL